MGAKRESKYYLLTSSLSAMCRRVLWLLALMDAKFSGIAIGKGTGVRGFIRCNRPWLITIGARCLIWDKVSFISEVKQGRLVIGDSTEVNRLTKIDISGDVIIGDQVVISEQVAIYSHDHGLDPHNPPLVNELIIENDVWIGRGATILSGCRFIGNGAVVAAGSVVTKDVQSKTLVGGNPARLIRHI